MEKGNWLRVVASIVFLVLSYVGKNEGVIVDNGVNYIVIGTTFTASFAYTNLTNAVTLAVDTLNSKGGVNINGTNYMYKFIQYPDGFNDVIVKVTYAYLLNHQNVDFFLGPFYSLSNTASTSAESLKHLVILTEFPADDGFNFSPKNYTLSMSPTLDSYSTACAVTVKQAMTAADPKKNVTVFVAYDATSILLGQNAVELLPSLGMIVVGNMSYDCNVETFQEIARNISEKRPDIVLGGGDSDSNLLIPAIRREIGLSHGAWNPTIATFSYNFPNSNWWQEGLLYPSAWSPIFPITQSDDYFGTATDFNNAFFALAGSLPFSGDAIAAASMLTIHTLINATQSLDSATLTAYAKSGANITNSFYGEISFKGLSLARPYVCIQNIGTQYPIVGPDSYTLTQVEFNPKIVYPANFFNNGNNDIIRNVLISTLGFAFVALIVVILVSIIILKKYHLVFLKRRNVFA